MLLRALFSQNAREAPLPPLPAPSPPGPADAASSAQAHGDAVTSRTTASSEAAASGRQAAASTQGAKRAQLAEERSGPAEEWRPPQVTQAGSPVFRAVNFELRSAGVSLHGHCDAARPWLATSRHAARPTAVLRLQALRTTEYAGRGGWDRSVRLRAILLDFSRLREDVRLFCGSSPATPCERPSVTVHAQDSTSAAAAPQPPRLLLPLWCPVRELAGNVGTACIASLIGPCLPRWADQMLACHRRAAPGTGGTRAHAHGSAVPRCSRRAIVGAAAYCRVHMRGIIMRAQDASVCATRIFLPCAASPARRLER